MAPLRVSRWRLHTTLLSNQHMRHEKEVIDSHDEKGKPLYHVCVCVCDTPVPTKDDHSLCFPVLVSVTHKSYSLDSFIP